MESYEAPSQVSKYQTWVKEVAGSDKRSRLLNYSTNYGRKKVLLSKLYLDFLNDALIRLFLTIHFKFAFYKVNGTVFFARKSSFEQMPTLQMSQQP